MELSWKTVFGFSVNPQRFIDAEEPYAASIDARLDAARQVIDRGGHVAFHFDPVVAYGGWRSDYTDLARRLSLFPRRITSYNVCYTKLLRNAHLRKRFNYPLHGSAG